ncbi:hypothetical protein HYU82_01170 [Candidatus Saccharibacteria bacterium]|nr:hypothetical protein [Candidatus Saccharibacteria bacterium]
MNMNAGAILVSILAGFLITIGSGIFDREVFPIMDERKCLLSEEVAGLPFAYKGKPDFRCMPGDLVNGVLDRSAWDAYEPKYFFIDVLIWSAAAFLPITYVVRARQK